MNGYFRVEPTAASTDIVLYAPTEGGSPVTYSMVTEYLTGKALGFDPDTLTRGVAQAAKADTRVVLNRVPISAVSESITMSISADKMEASILLFAPSEKGARLGADDILQYINPRGVSFGILTDTINDLIENPRYCEWIVIAKGKLPTESVDGYIEYLFNTDSKQRPAVLPDGSVDFHNLNIVQPCASGQTLAILHKPVPGEAGHYVDSTIYKARDVREVSFKYGNNVYVSEDGLELRAQVDGSVALVSGQVFVNNSISFKNIGIATGNINFEGSVLVEENVDANFSIKAKGDVIVNGIVESANIEAGGNIIIAKGMNGKGTGKLNAGGNIIAKYMENVEANAGGYISAEAIMHSNVTAGGDIIVDGRKGVISGGKATSGGCIEVKTLGAEMANDTVVEVGISPVIKHEIQTLRQSVAEKQKVLAQIQPVLQNLALKIKSGGALSNEQKVYVSKLMTTQKATTEELETMTTRLMELEDTYNADSPSEVRVRDIAYPGTRVCISDVSMAVKTPAKYCKFIKLRGDVKIAAYD